MDKNIINTNSIDQIKEIFVALDFAAFKHRHQKRKGIIPIPYINHPIRVAALVLNKIENPDIEMIQAALLHDTIEDTKTTIDEIQAKFGSRVGEIVIELTDNMSQPYFVRKKLQIEKASKLSYEARCIKIADKICNINDILYTRVGWIKSRKLRYIKWSMKVIDQIRGTNKEMEIEFDQLIFESEKILKTKLFSY
jgi:GTP diphosphokinase / guanosine-3',5'-bis(diphosphate) 3'-diphosphatase